jgi:hypothetical protein
MGPRHDFRDKFVPCGAATVAVKDLSGLVVGDRVLVQRHGTKEWITAIGMDRIPANMRKKPDGTRVDSTKQWESGDRESFKCFCVRTAPSALSALCIWWSIVGCCVPLTAVAT